MSKYFLLDFRPRRYSATEIMMFGWQQVREIDEDEYDYWMNNLLPSGVTLLTSERIPTPLTHTTPQ